MKTKGKRIYNIIFAVISLLPIVWAIVYFADSYYGIAENPQVNKIAAFFVPIIICVILISAYATLVFLYSGMKYFLFSPKKTPLKNSWNVAKFFIAAVAFLPIVDTYIYPIYRTLKGLL